MLQNALQDLNAHIHYSVKANPNLAILKSFARENIGADVVSQGEIRRAQAAGIPNDKIIFSGAGKSDEELGFALDNNIAQINIESEAELEAIANIAKAKNKSAPIALRVNPDVDAKTHKKITTGTSQNKFGVPWQQSEAILNKAKELTGIEIVGLAMHIGSQITSRAPFDAAFERLASLAEDLRAKGFPIRTLDLGGGLGATYRSDGDAALDVNEYAQAIRERFGTLPYRLLLEPGRFLVADAGVLLTKVLYEKRAGEKRFVIVDAAMNDLLRPALYDAHHDIVPVRRAEASAPMSPADVVGPVCETSDTLATNLPLPPMKPGSLLAILQAGAYGAALSSMYNTRPSAPEVIVSGERMALVRSRPDYDEMLAQEHIPPWLAEECAP